MSDRGQMPVPPDKPDLPGLIRFAEEMLRTLDDPGALRNAVVHGSVGVGSLNLNAVTAATEYASLNDCSGGVRVGPGSGPIVLGEGVLGSPIRTVGGASVSDAGSPRLVVASAAIAIDAPAARLIVTRHAPILSWLDSTAVFIPRSIREPFVGDLREDLAARAAAGWSPTRLRWVALSQIAWLMFRWLWSSGIFRR